MATARMPLLNDHLRDSHAKMVLFDLPDDVILSIMTLLDVVDVISFRRTSRRTHALSLEPTLWLHIYRDLCSYLPPPRLSGPPESLPRSRVEEIVVHMDRLERTWQPAPDSVESIITPTREREFRPVVPESSNDHIRNMDLLPGGRWLLTLIEDGVALWDLDAEDIQVSLKKIISFEHPGRKLGCRRYWVHYEDMPRACKVFTSEDYDVNGTRITELSLWEIQVQPEPTSAKLRTYVLPCGAENVSVYHDRFGFLFDPTRGHADGFSIIILNWELSYQDHYVGSSIRRPGSCWLARLKVLPNDMALFIANTELFIYQVPPMALASEITSLPSPTPILKWSYNNNIIHNDGERFSRSTRMTQQWDGIPPPNGISCVMSIPAASDIYTISVPMHGLTSLWLEPQVEVTPLPKTTPRRSSYGRRRGAWEEPVDLQATYSDMFLCGIAPPGKDRSGSGSSWKRRVRPEGQTRGTPEIVLLDEFSGRLCMAMGRKGRPVLVWDFI